MLSDVEIDEGAIASIRSQGIIGGRYISIQLGPSNKMLKNGDQIHDTEPAFMLEDVIGNLINGIGSKPDNKSNNNGGDGNQPQPQSDNQKTQPKK